MGRSLGDQEVKEHGVIDTPEIALSEVDLAEEPFFLLASDGVWEFLESKYVIETLAKNMKLYGHSKTVERLVKESKKRWHEEEGGYCDDITSVLVQLPG